MKKIISLFLMIAMLFSVSVFAEEEVFTLHNGLLFGMEKEEAIAIEEENGIILQPTKYDMYGTSSYGGSVEKANAYLWIGTIAGQKESGLIIKFDENDKLKYVTYEFSDLSSYDILNESLIEKYGSPSFTSDKGGSPFSHEKNGETVSATCIVKTTDSQYAEWLIPYSDTQDILISHECYYRERIPTSTKNTYHNWKYHTIDYILLSEERTEEIRTLISQYSDDL